MLGIPEHLEAFERMAETIVLRERHITEALTEPQLQVWVPWAIGGLSVEQVGALRGCAVEDVEQRLADARARLREFIVSNHMSWLPDGHAGRSKEGT